MLKLLLGLGLFAFVLAAAGDQAVAPSCSLAPGWTQDGPPRYYTTDNLYEYMDGNSEGYFSYNFQNMHGVTCKQGETTFVVDISDMGDADNAFGWFSATRDLRHPAYPVGLGRADCAAPPDFRQGQVLRGDRRQPGRRLHGPAEAVGGRLGQAGAGQHVSAPGACLVPHRKAANAEAGSGKRARAESPQARVRGAIRLRQGVRGVGGNARIRRRRHAEPSPAIRRSHSPSSWATKRFRAPTNTWDGCALSGPAATSPGTPFRRTAWIRWR